MTADQAKDLIQVSLPLFRRSTPPEGCRVKLKVDYFTEPGGEERVTFFSIAVPTTGRLDDRPYRDNALSLPLSKLTKLNGADDAASVLAKKFGELADLPWRKSLTPAPGALG